MFHLKEVISKYPTSADDLKLLVKRSARTSELLVTVHLLA